MFLLYNSNNYPERNQRFAEFTFRMADKVKLSGEIRKTKFLYNLLVKKRLVEFKDSDPITIANQLDKVITILNSMYGDKWDFIINPTDPVEGKYYLDIGVVIHYPSLIITNGKGDPEEFYFNGEYDEETGEDVDERGHTFDVAMDIHCSSSTDRHVIRDLLVILKIQSGIGLPNEVCFMSFEGTRASQSLAEYHTSYMHSHLGRRMPGYNQAMALTPNTFCLGESVIGDHLQMGLQEGYSFEETDFEMLLHLIDEYVIWESISGGPYVLMSTINANRTATRTPGELSKTINKQTLMSLYSSEQVLNMFSEDHYKKLNFVLVENRYKIKQDNAFEKVILDALIHEGIYTNYFVYTPKDGKYIKYDRGSIVSGSTVNGIEIYDYKIGGKEPQIQFRDTVLKYHIKMPNEEQAQVFNYNVLRVHPNFIEYVKEIVDKEIYKASIKEASRKVTDQQLA